MEVTSEINEAYQYITEKLSLNDRLRLAALLLDNVAKDNITLVEKSDTWTEQDQSDISAFSLSYTEHWGEITVTAHYLHNVHPCKILRVEFIEPLNITPYRLSKDIGVTQTRISEILAEKRAITADTALRLSKYFGNSAQFWMNLQTQYDLRKAQNENKEFYSKIPAIL